ncbi:MAG: hypothetical protein GY944_04580 [bacterium]|nr:hypothetical protein [bacterium]
MTEAETIVRECIAKLERLLEEPKHIPAPVCEIDLNTILRSVAAESGVSWREIVGPSRRAHVSRARKMFCRRATRAGRWSQAAIGEKINRERTTVLYLARGQR